MIFSMHYEQFNAKSFQVSVIFELVALAIECFVLCVYSVGYQREQNESNVAVS